MSGGVFCTCSREARVHRIGGACYTATTTTAPLMVTATRPASTVKLPAATAGRGGAPAPCTLRRCPDIVF